MDVKRIGITASDDGALVHALSAFLRHLGPVVRYRGTPYRVELGTIGSEPVRCGESLRGGADVILDRASRFDPYHRSRGYQAACSRVPMINNPYTLGTYNKHSTYHLLSQAMHPEDRFPTTVLLPTFGPVSPDQRAEERWQREQEAIAAHTRFGWDPARRETDWGAVAERMRIIDVYLEHARAVRERSYPARDFLRETMAEVFHDRYPVYLKRADGGGGRGVHRVSSLPELYAAYDLSSGYAVHLQEAVVDHDVFVRCLGVGPQVAQMGYEPEAPHHLRYSLDKPRLPPAASARLRGYVRLVGAYHRWTLNSFEAPIVGGRLHPIDFANGMPDLDLTSLHVHFPLLLVDLTRWLTYCAVAGPDLRLDLEQEPVLRALADPAASPLEKHARGVAFGDAYFAAAAGDFAAFCAESFGRVEEQMVDFYDRGFRPFIERAVEESFIPRPEHGAFVEHYAQVLETHFRRDPGAYLAHELPG
jgi:hypothetical protein